MEQFTVEEKNNLLEIFDEVINFISRYIESGGGSGYKTYLKWLEIQKTVAEKFDYPYEFIAVLIEHYSHLSTSDEIKYIIHGDIKKKISQTDIDAAAGLSVRYLFILENISYVFIKFIKYHSEYSYGEISAKYLRNCTFPDMERLKQRLEQDNDVLDEGTKDTYLWIINKTLTGENWIKVDNFDFIEKIRNSHIKVSEVLSREATGFKLIMPINPSLAPPNKGWCYIATTCYGSYDAVQVLTFRHYRDEYLSQSFWGRLFIKTYYTLSPPVANWLKNKHRLNTFIRKNFLDLIYNFLKKKY